MIRSRLMSAKYGIFASAALLLLIGTAEVGLRVHDSWTRADAGPSVPGRPLLTRSWRVHHELRPGRTYAVRHPDSGRSVELNINSFGLRGPEPAVPKPPGTYRVLCLGDEATLAPTMKEAETFCGRLAAHLEPSLPLRAEVINAGVPGYCPLLCCLVLRHSLLALQPDLVVMNFDMSDVADDYRYRRHARMGADGQPVACPHPALAAAPENQETHWTERILLVRWLKDRALSWAFSREDSDEDRGLLAPNGRYAWLREDTAAGSVYVEQAFSALPHLNRMVTDSHARFVVATYPVPWQVSPEAGSPELRRNFGVAENAVHRSREPFEALARYCRQYDIPFCDTSSAFSQAEQPERLFLRSAPRFSAEGHQLYARILADFLRRAVRAPWREGPRDRGSPGDSSPAFSVN